MGNLNGILVYKAEYGTARMHAPDPTDVLFSGDAFDSCADCSVSETLDLTCICAQSAGLPKRETTIELEASLDQTRGEAGTGVFSFANGLLDCHVL
jgi:hypothetical protein